MRYTQGNAPIWLFSFVDLTLLLLIAFTQIAYDPALAKVDWGEIDVPRIESPLDRAAAERLDSRWQVRVHPPVEPASAAPSAPFELASAGEPEPEPEFGPRLGASALRAGLAKLRAIGARKPLLAPHRDSRSEDLLVAVGLVDQYWPGARGAAVSPPPAVSAGPPPAQESERR